MKNKRLFLILGGAAFFFIATLTFDPFLRQMFVRPKRSDTAPGEQVMKLNIFEEYERDPKQADKEYGGKTVIVPGNFEEVALAKGKPGRVIVTYSVPGFLGAYAAECIDSPDLLSIPKGASVIIKGTSKHLSETWYGEVSALTIVPLPELRDANVMRNQRGP